MCYSVINCTQYRDTSRIIYVIFMCAWWFRVLEGGRSDGDGDEAETEIARLRTARARAARNSAFIHCLARRSVGRLIGWLVGWFTKRSNPDTRRSPTPLTRRTRRWQDTSYPSTTRVRSHEAPNLIPWRSFQ